MLLVRARDLQQLAQLDVDFTCRILGTGENAKVQGGAE